MAKDNILFWNTLRLAIPRYIHKREVKIDPRNKQFILCYTLFFQIRSR